MLRLGIGIVAMVVLAEMVMRIVGPQMPEASIWPTVETDIKSEQLTELGTEPELLLIGTSATEAALDPVRLEALTGLSAYNSAFPFSSPLSHEIWLNEVVPADWAPRLLVIGMQPSPPDEIATGLMVEGLQKAVRDRVVGDLFGWSALARRRGVLADWDQLSSWDHLEKSGYMTSLGHQTGYYDRLITSEASEVSAGRNELSAEQTAALGRIIQSSRDAGLEVVILVEPVFGMRSSRADTAAYISWLEEQARSWGIPVWNAHDLEWDDELWADEHHFNRAGTEAFTRYVATLIETNARWVAG